ncbi:hypothetical protein ACV229_20985 [Burkholderia sp. MR1-5-21]
MRKCFNKILRCIFASRKAWQCLAAFVLCAMFGATSAQSETPAFPDTLNHTEWRYVGASYGGDDVYIDTKRSRRVDDDTGETLAIVLVNRMNCADGPKPGSRTAARTQCLNAFGYASYIVEHVYWCDAKGSRAHDVGTYSSILFDDYDGNGKIIRKASVKDRPEMDVIEPDMPSVRAREWVCKNLS